jgi:hypothetical protein
VVKTPGRQSPNPESPASCLDDWLSVTGSRISPYLIAATGLGRAAELARQLPGVHLAILEVHLFPQAAVPDLSILVKERPQVAALLKILQPPHWKVLLAQWAERRDRRIPSFWLEFDLSRSGETLPMPNLCAKLRETADRRWLIDSLLPRLQGGPLTRWQREAAERCVQELPPSAQLLYAFSLLPRGGDLRLEFYGLSPAEMPAYLESVEAPVSRADVVRAARPFTGAERTHLSLDLGPDRIRPRIGIEGSFARQPAREPRWRQLLARLAHHGLCTTAQREALLAWPGWDSFWTAPALWPRETAWTGAFCVRYLSHLKVICRPGRPLQSKAYLAFHAYRRRPGEDRSSARRG